MPDSAEWDVRRDFDPNRKLVTLYAELHVKFTSHEVLFAVFSVDFYNKISDFVNKIRNKRIYKKYF